MRNGLAPARVLEDHGALDVYAHLPGTAAHLRNSLVYAARAGRLSSVDDVRLSWGMMESYYWDMRDQRPVGFSYKYGSGSKGCQMTMHNTSVKKGDKGTRTIRQYAGAAAMNAAS